MRRVAKRVALGGHDVPEQTIRRRYVRGLLNFFDLYRPLADAWQFYDNSAAGNAILVAEGSEEDAERIHGVSQWQTVLQTAKTAGMLR
jgi:predicted ABC-type ATPase